MDLYEKYAVAREIYHDLRCDLTHSDPMVAAYAARKLGRARRRCQRLREQWLRETEREYA